MPPPTIFRKEGGLRARGEFYKRSEPGKPLLTVITVVRNGDHHLERTIQSVLNQTYENIEHIIIDGASTDRTIDIIKKYEKNIAYWLSEPDHGLYDAMNKGVRKAAGDWIYFLGGDDLLLDTLHALVPYFRNPNGIYYGDVYRSALHKLYDGKFGWYKLILLNISHQAIFYPKRVFEKYAYTTKYKMMADHALNIVCYGDKEFHFTYVPMLICIFNDRGRSSYTDDIEFGKDKRSLIKTNLSFSIYASYCVIRSIHRVMAYFVALPRRIGVIGSKRE